MLPQQYPGGKGGAGVHQKIINLMPPHQIYIEPFVGGGNIYARKKPAEASIIIDIDERSSDYWKSNALPATTVIHGDAISVLQNLPWHGNELVYCDPPYMMATKSGRVYRHEFTDQQHRDLLALLMTIPAAVMLSGYRSDMYSTMLRHWRRIDFQAMTQGGLRTESLWLNYEPPAVPAELTYVGSNYRERERIKRKKARWKARLEKLPAAERAAILEILIQSNAPGDTTAPGDDSKPAAGGMDCRQIGNVVRSGALQQALKRDPGASLVWENG